MPVRKTGLVSQAEYLLDALRHIEAVAQSAQKTVAVRAALGERLGGPKIFARACAVKAEAIPRPFGKSCGLVGDFGPEEGAVAGRMRPMARRAGRRVKR
jgi:hypothetical protein